MTVVVLEVEQLRQVVAEAVREALGATVLKQKSLRELQPGEGRHEDLILGDCGLFCGENEGTLAMATEKIKGAV